MRRRLWTLLAVLACVSGEHLMGGHLDNNARTKSRSGKTESPSTSGRETHTSDLDLDLVAEESTVAAVVAAGTPAKTSTDDDGDAPRYRIPYPFAFNGGEPFSLEKDPITGKIDLAKAPPVRALNAGRYREREDEEIDSEDGREDEGTYSERERTKGNVDVSPNEINTYTPNFHDFLNLPVHYSSDKYGNDEYPLISNSYANTKVQSGANSYSTYNHKPYHPENDLYVRPMKVSYASMMKTSTHETTSVNDLKTKWTNSASTATIMASVPVTTTNSSRITLSTSTRAPVVTTWKPPSPPISFHSIDRTVMQMENETNLLPIEKLHASGHVESHRNPGNVPTRSPNDGATERTQIVNRYKEQSNFNNFVLPHARPETKPSAQDEGYKDIYDIFKLPDGDGENEDERESDSDDNSDGDSVDEAENDESDYFLPFKELLKKDVTSTSTPSTTTSAATSSSTDTTTVTTTTVTASSTGTTTIATTPWRSSSVPPARQEDALASDTLQLPTMPQRPFVPSSPNSNRQQSITEHHDVIINHGYRPSSMIKSEPDRTGIVIESTSNIVIPPDQDTVSFVLGNRQNVDGGYYTIGTALGENIYDSSPDMDTPPFWSIRNDPHVPIKEVKHEHHSSASVTESNPERVTYKWWSPTSSALKGSNELEPARLQTPLAASVVHDMKNQSDQRDPGYVTFPDDETRNKDATTEEHVLVVNEADGSVRESPIKTTLATMTTIATNATKLHFPTVGGDLPQLAEDLMPPAESSRPPSYYYQYQFDTPRPDHQRPQRLPLPSRVKPYSGPHSVPPSDVGMRKRPYSPDTKLPNILPQFRPNAKASHGHRGQDVIGTMPAGQGLHTRIRQPNHPPSRRPPPPPPPPSYLQRLNPPPPPIHAVRLALVPTSKADVVALPHETEPTIRRFRPPHSGGPSISRGNSENAPSNRLLAHGIGQEMVNSGVEGGGENRKEDNRIKSEIAGERENDSSERYLEEPPMMPPRPPFFPKRRTADPPRVTTLQMIQHHGEFGDENEDDGNDDEAELARPARPLIVHEAERRKLDEHETTGTGEQPVYVVYPVNTAVNIHPDDNDSEKDGSVVVGTRGPQRPLPPDTLLQNERDETHTVYNGRPVALDFPYPLERPDPSSVFPAAGVKETPVLVPSEQRQQQQQQQQQVSAATNERENGKIEQDAVNVIPYLQDFLPYRKKNDAAISVTLHRTASFATTSASTLVSAASTPIAYVYTPTHATYPDRHFDDIDEHDNDKDADAVASVDAKQTVLLPSQQPSSSSSSAPEPQSFMAPFIASMSAETSNKNGWSVIVVDPPAVAERKSDSDDNETKFDEVDTQTERNDFDADNFKPQLFGGFQPLYEFPIEDTEHQNDTSTEMDMARHSKELPSVPDRG